MNVTASIHRTRWLSTLHAAPTQDPRAWAAALTPGSDVVPIVNLTRDVRDEAGLRAGLERMRAGGATPLAQVSLGYATRPVADVVSEIAHWASYPFAGVFFDHAPSGPYQVGPVVAAVRAAERHGLGWQVLNAGVPVDPAYRLLDATVCTFEGSWSDYLLWPAEECRPGDGHLVFDVPANQLAVARELIEARAAGLALVSARATAYPSQRRSHDPSPSALWTAGAAGRG